MREILLLTLLLSYLPNPESMVWDAGTLRFFLPMFIIAAIVVVVAAAVVVKLLSTLFQDKYYLGVRNHSKHFK